MTRYLVDNSASVRALNGVRRVAERLDAITRSTADQFVTCPPQVLEFCFSARNSAEHDQLWDEITLGIPLINHPENRDVLAIQSALWANGLVRAAGSLDILIAAYAILNDAVVLTCDEDFLHIASVTELKVEYITPKPHITREDFERAAFVSRDLLDPDFVKRIHKL